jgi:hypothetical protein
MAMTTNSSVSVKARFVSMTLLQRSSETPHSRVHVMPSHRVKVLRCFAPAEWGELRPLPPAHTVTPRNLPRSPTGVSP